MKRIPACDACGNQDFSVRIVRKPETVEVIPASEYFQSRSMAAVPLILVYIDYIAQCKVCGAEYSWSDA